MDVVSSARNTGYIHPRRGFNVVVVIPAKNEEDTISSCLRSVVAASRRAAKDIDRLAIVVVADGCTDRTVEIAHSVLAPDPSSSVAECDLGNVALVRNFGVHVGRTALGFVRADRTWLASTDADTTVPNDWLVKHLAAASRGLRAIAGVVDIDSFDGLPGIARRHFAETYTSLLPPSGDHPHVHAANLGVRLDAFDTAGGWGCLPRSEDRDLWTRLQQTGARLESTIDLRVVTSGRSIGRVAGGFAACLREQVLGLAELESDTDERRSA